MRQSTVDLIIEYAASGLASGDRQRINRLVMELATRWPHEPALGIAFAITSAAAALEDMMADAGSKACAQMGYRLAALVSADVHAIQALGQLPAMGHDLLHFWRRMDPYFHRLAQSD